MEVAGVEPAPSELHFSLNRCRSHYTPMWRLFLLPKPRCEVQPPIQLLRALSSPLPPANGIEPLASGSQPRGQGRRKLTLSQAPKPLPARLVDAGQLEPGYRSLVQIDTHHR